MPFDNDDDFFNNDPFESMIKNFFGNNRRFNEEQGASPENWNGLPENIIETKNKFYLVLDLSQLEKVQAKMNGTVLEIKSTKESLNYNIPKNIAKKKFSSRFNNGILEVTFTK